MTPRGIRNNNPGNIRRTDINWRGELVGGDPAFETFDTPEHGIRALAKVLQSYQRKYKINTIRKAIARYAPTSENDTEAYVTSVSKHSGVDADARIDFHDLQYLLPIVKAIILHENGRQPYSTALIRRALEMP